MRINIKWYYNELLGYLIMSITSTLVIDNNKNKSECIFSSRNVFYVETATQRKQNDSIFKSFDFNKNFVGNVYNRP